MLRIPAAAGAVRSRLLFLLNGSALRLNRPALGAARGMGALLSLLLPGTAFRLQRAATGAMLFQIVAVVELLAASITLQLVLLILHVESPFLNPLEWRFVTTTDASNPVTG